MPDEDRNKSWEEIRASKPLDERRVAAYERLMEAETMLYQRWEQRGVGMDWIGEALGFPIDDPELWVAEMGEKVAALGGHLELIAVFPEGAVRLLAEPGPEGVASENPE